MEVKTCEALRRCRKKEGLEEKSVMKWYKEAVADDKAKILINTIEAVRVFV